MPTFEQIESLQTQCYIHYKSGWEISDFSSVKLGEKECIFKVTFSKKQNEKQVDDSPKSVYVLSDGSVIRS
jgi:hypothetical protein